jgi:hypothetical protein
MGELLDNTDDSDLIPFRGTDSVFVTPLKDISNIQEIIIATGNPTARIIITNNGVQSGNRRCSYTSSTNPIITIATVT